MLDIYTRIVAPDRNTRLTILLEFFYAESFLHFLAFFFLSLRQFGISNENSDPRFVIRVEGMKGFKLGFVAIQSDFLHVVFLSFIKG